MTSATMLAYLPRRHFSAVAVIVLGLILDWLLPAYVLSLLLSMASRVVIGAALIGTGLALVIPANLAFQSAGTRVEPWKASTYVGYEWNLCTGA